MLFEYVCYLSSYWSTYIIGVRMLLEYVCYWRTYVI